MLRVVLVERLATRKEQEEDDDEEWEKIYSAPRPVVSNKEAGEGKGRGQATAFRLGGEFCSGERKGTSGN